MSNVLLCQGTYAERPYYAADDCQNIYCVEELCYYLYHNAYLLDDRFVTEALAVWAEEEIDMPELAKSIRRCIGRSDALSRLVTELRDKIGYYSEESWNELLKEIGRNNRLTVEERRKCRADGFVNEGRLALALDEYEVLIRETSYDQTALRAKVYHNMGVCAAGLFMFMKAADYFSKAYDTYANVESYEAMLSAMKMYMTQAEYLDFLSKHRESYEDSLEVERRFEVLKLDWNNQPTRRFLMELESKKEQGAVYYDGIEGLTGNIKQEYKDCVFRNRGL